MGPRRDHRRLRAADSHDSPRRDHQLPPDGNAGGQHHMASRVITREAFKLAGDPTKYPGQIKEGLRAVAAEEVVSQRRLRVPGRAGRRPGTDRRESTPALYDPLLGKTYAEIGAEARSMHKCQGMASCCRCRSPRPRPAISSSKQRCRRSWRRTKRRCSTASTPACEPLEVRRRGARRRISPTG